MRAYKLLILSVLCLCGCMQHNGYIGDWFGTWYIESITVNGEENPAYQGNYFMQFQADKVRICEVDPAYPDLLAECFGSWQASGDVLELNFSYTGGGNYWNPSERPNGTLMYTYLKPDINILKITSMTSKRMVLTLSREDETIVYNLRKQ